MSEKHKCPGRDSSITVERGLDLTTMDISRATTLACGPNGQMRIARLAVVAGLMLTLAVLTPVAVAESSAPSQPPSAQQQEKDPGFFESVKRWFERGFSKFKGGMDDAKTNMDKLNEKAAAASKDLGEKAAQAGRDAAEAMKKIPATRVVEGRQRCDTAPNGAPDCRVAAQTICTAKGYASGTSVDFVSAEKCPPAVWMNRRKPEPGECVTETFVTRAMCQ